ncbi:MAG: glycine zipper 2TM domain-containing protein [Burkholderiaceae bacterium]
MKSSVVIAIAALSTGLCAAQEVGRVISSTPVMQQVAVPQQVCSNDAVIVPNQPTGAGAAIGAIAGGVLGNAVGHGGGRAAATMLGVFGGALVGDRVEGQGAQYQNVQRCSTQTSYENRLTSYNVVYEYAGKQYSVQMPYDPGPTINLQVSPADAGAAQAPTAPIASAQPYVQPVYAQPVYGQPVYTQPVYTAPVVIETGTYYYPYYARPYYRSPYYPPVGVNLQFGFGGGGRHGHWR